MAGLKEYNGHYCESEYEYAFVGFLEAEGWKCSSGNNIPRITKRDVLIADDFKTFISDTNPDLTEDEITQIFDNVRLAGGESDFATLHKIYGWMTNGIKFTPHDGIPRTIPLINFEKDDIDKNIFRVVNQFTIEYTNNGQKKNRRPDVILFVNGMPLCIIELKNPADANATVYDAWEQINIRYWRDIAAKTFQEMLEKTIEEYHERRKHLSAEEAGEAQEQASEDIIKIATEQALIILRQMKENRASFRKIGLTFEEKAFYDILISLRDQYNFEYGTDREVDGVIINDKCKALARKVKEIIDTKSSFTDWLNNQNVRNELKLEIKICLVKNGYPPQYSPEVFNKVMEQVENFEEFSGNNTISYYERKSEPVMMAAEEKNAYGAANKTKVSRK